MPYLQAMSGIANGKMDTASKMQDLGRQVLNNPGMLAPGTPLGTMAAQLGVSVSQQATDFLNSAPSGVSEAIRAGLMSAIAEALPVTWAWMPGYDWRVSISESKNSEKSAGGMTIFIESRYPDDPVPGR